jgi:tetratricopeptide repeat protein
MYAEAITEFKTGVKLSGSPLMLALLGHAYAVSGKTSEAKQVPQRSTALQDQRYVSPYMVAAIYAGLGDHEQAFKWLEAAVEERRHLVNEPESRPRLRKAPYPAPIHGYPRRIRFRP